MKRQRQYGGISLSAFHSTAACRLFIITWSSACPLPPLPPPSLWLYSSHGTPLFLHPTRPAPPCSVRSPALFVQMEQKRKWKPESTVNPFLGLCSTFLLFFNLLVACFWWWFVYQEGVAKVFFLHEMGKNSLAFTDHPAKNTSKSLLFRVAAPQMKIITVV